MKARSLLFAFVLGACSGPPIASNIDGEPVCSDFQMGPTRISMKGGLRNPISVTVKDGKDVVAKSILFGRRSEQQTPTRILIPDANESYTVEWAQCENERAPEAINTSKKTSEQLDLHYECSNPSVYKSDTLTTKKGDPQSHALKIPAPPSTACWSSSP